MWITSAEYQRLKAVEESAKKLLDELDVIKKRSYIISIERVGRENVFVFARGEGLYEIRTFSTLSDNLPEWKGNLLR